MHDHDLEHCHDPWWVWFFHLTLGTFADHFALGDRHEEKR